MNSVVGIDADEMSVERRMVDFRQWQSICHNRLTPLLVAIFDDVSGIEQQRFRQAGERAAPAICGEYCLAKADLMQALLHSSQRVSSFFGRRRAGVVGGSKLRQSCRLV